MLEQAMSVLPASARGELHNSSPAIELERDAASRAGGRPHAGRRRDGHRGALSLHHPQPRPNEEIMFKKVIIGDDGLDGGRDAISLAKSLAPDAELILATAYPYDSTPSRFALLGYGNALREETKKGLSRARDAAGIPDARTVAIPDTSPAHALHHLAEEEHADLIVIGSAHRGGAGRMLLGDVARDMLHGAPCPVAVAPKGFTGGTPATIGVAFDGGPEARGALTVATDLARACHAGLVVREVVESNIFPSVGGYPMANIPEILDDLRDEAQKTLDEAVADLGVEVEASAVTGVAAERLDELATEVDLIVCGSRGWGMVRRVILGSTADRLIHRSTSPVLVVPRTAAVNQSEAPVEAIQRGLSSDSP
jgi:nucleotide-binding universal stress UspA family protein